MALFTSASNYNSASGSNPSRSAQYPNANVPGNLLVCFVLTVGSSIGSIAITDDSGLNTWVQAGSWFNYTGTSYVGVFYVLSAGNSTKATVSEGGTGQTYGAIAIAEYSHTSGFTVALDATGHGQGTTTLSYNVVTNIDDDLIFGGLSGAPAVPGGSFTAPLSSGVTGMGILEWLDAGTASTVAVVGTTASTWQGFGASFSATPTVTPSIAGNVGVNGATVSWTGTSSGSTTSEASGDYYISGLSNGSYTVTPTLSGYTFAPTSRSETYSGTEITGVNFTPTLITYSISGTTNVGLSTVSYSGAASGSALTDDFGNYSFSGLVVGSYTITPSMNGATFSPTTHSETITSSNITGVNFTSTSTPYSQAIVRDIFSRGNSANLGTNWTANSDATTTGTMGIVSDAAQPSVGGNAASFWNANTFNPNQYAQCIVNASSATSNSHGGGPTVRGSAGGYYRAFLNLNGTPGSFAVAKVVGGTFTALQSNVTVGLNGSLVRLEIVGTQISAYVDGVLEYQGNDSSLATGAPGVCGFMAASSPTTSLNSWEGGDLLWTRQGTVIPTVVSSGSQEPTVMYESNPQILSANPDGKIWKMWWTHGWVSPSPVIYYGESANGVSWTQYGSNPILSNGSNCVTHGFVLHNGSTYYGYYGNDHGAGNSVTTTLDLWESSNGVTGWAITNASVLSIGAGGAWDNQIVADPVVWIKSGTWYMLYQGKQSGTEYSVGLATSPDGITWTKYASNPVITASGGPTTDGDSLNGKTLTFDGSLYYLWGGTSPSGTLAPTDLSMWSSPDLHTWTACSKNPMYQRVLSSEGPNNIGGQVADACLVELNGTTYLFYDALNHQASGQIAISLATAPFTELQLVGMIFGSSIVSGNAGVAGATVSYSGTASGSVTADVNGNYVIPLSNGSYTITPSLGGYSFTPANSSQTVSSADITGVNFTAAAVATGLGSLMLMGCGK